MSLNTTNLKQKRGGRTIKQADRSSTFLFVLQDGQGREINLDGKKAQVSLHNPNNGRYWEDDTTVRGSEVEFNLPGNLADDDYILEIASDGYVFPSDNDLIITVTKGYAQLLSKETAERTRLTFEEIRKEVEEKAKADLDKQIVKIRGEKDTALEEIENKTQDGLKRIGDKSNNTLSTIDSKKNETLEGLDNTRKTFESNIDGALTQAIKDIPGKSYVDKKLDEILQNSLTYQGNDIVKYQIIEEAGKLYYVSDNLGGVIENDFLRVPVNGSSIDFKLKGKDKGIVLLYSLTDEDLRYAIHTTNVFRDYKIDFGKEVDEDLIFTSVTMPEDKVSVIKEEGL